MPKYRLVTPGPVPVPERVREAMARTLLHHRAPAFLPLLREVREGLRQVFQTEREVAILAGTGTSAMEAAVANVLSPGDKAVVVRGGKFGERWGELCDAYGVEVVAIDVEWGRAVEPGLLVAALDAHPDARAVLVQASETSTGVYHPIRELAEIIRGREDLLLVVDGISGVGVHDLPMDAWGIDVLVSGSQKSWMLPPGLAFVALSERARRAAGQSASRRYYLDLETALAAQEQNQTPFSSAVSLIVGLREALGLMLEDGLAALYRRHAERAQMTRAAVQALGLELFARESPANSCTSVRFPSGLDGAALLTVLRERYGVTLAGGQGRVAGQIFRIGHMGDIDALDTIATIAGLELALAELGYPAKIGEGTRAATEVVREFASAEE